MPDKICRPFRKKTKKKHLFCGNKDFPLLGIPFSSAVVEGLSGDAASQTILDFFKVLRIRTCSVTVHLPD